MNVDHSTTPKDHAGYFFREKSVKNLFYTQTELRIFFPIFQKFYSGWEGGGSVLHFDNCALLSCIKNYLQK